MVYDYSDIFSYLDTILFLATSHINSCCPLVKFCLGGGWQFLDGKFIALVKFCLGGGWQFLDGKFIALVKFCLGSG